MRVIFAALLLQAPSSEPQTSGAEQAYEDGIAAYETSDFDRAIESFSAAFALAAEIEDPTERSLAMNRLRFNLARAHVGAWTIDREVEHLRTAQSIVENYREEERREGRDPDTDLDLKRLERELNAAMAATRESDRVRTETEAQDGADAQDDEVGAGPPGPKREPTPSDDSPPPVDRSRAPIVAGSVLTALGGVSLGVMGVAFAQGQSIEAAYLNEPSADGRIRLDQQGSTWNTVAGVTGGVGAALIVAGVATLAVGVKRRRAAVSPTVALGRTQFVFGLGGEF